MRDFSPDDVNGPPHPDNASAWADDDAPNVYRELDAADQFYTHYSGLAAPLAHPTHITAPFDFGETALRDETYTRVANLTVTNPGGFLVSKAQINLASSEEGDVRRVLLSVGAPADASGSGEERLVVQARYDGRGGDVALNLVHVRERRVGESAQRQRQVLRVYLNGNTRTHRFVVRAAVASSAPGDAPWTGFTVQSAGISQGASNAFLVQRAPLASDLAPTEVPVDAYYCVPASPSRSEFANAVYAASSTRGAETLPPRCAQERNAFAPLKPWSLARLAMRDGQDLPLDQPSALFTGGGALHLNLLF